MAVTKTDVSADIPSSDSLLVVSDGETVEASTENTNNTTLLGPLIVAMNWIIDQGLQAGVESIATALQRFQGGITTDAIASETTNGDITLTTTSTGKFKYQSGTVAASEVLTVGNYNTLVTGSGVTVMTGATNSVNGVQGLAPQPLVGEQNLPLRGNATYSTGWEAKASNFTIENGGKYIVGSSVTAITLPNSPSVNYEFELVAGSGTTLSAVTLTQAASGEYINGTNGSLVLDADASAYKGTCVNTGASNIGWRLDVGQQSLPSVVTSLASSGRLTFESGNPISTTAQTAKTTVYFTPDEHGNLLALWDGTEWLNRSYTELSASVPATTVTPFDVFATYSGGAVAISTVNWSNDTTRATAVSRTSEGIWTQTSDKTMRLLGTGRTTSSSGESQQTASSWLLATVNNTVGIDLLADQMSTNNWTYNATTYRAANANTTVGQTRVEFVLPTAGWVTAQVWSEASGGGATADFALGIGTDSTSVNSATILSGATNSSGNLRLTATYSGFLAAGYHYVQWLEKADATFSTTFFGRKVSGTTYMQAGLQVGVNI